MPFTPLHFGPGLLLKAAAPRHVSFTAFVASQVLIDLESLYNILRGAWPVHRELHTFAFGRCEPRRNWVRRCWVAASVA